MVTTLRFANTEIRDRVASLLDGIEIGFEYGMHTCSLRIDTDDFKKVDATLLTNGLMVSHGSSDVGFFIRPIPVASH